MHALPLLTVCCRLQRSSLEQAAQQSPPSPSAMTRSPGPSHEAATTPQPSLQAPGSAVDLLLEPFGHRTAPRSPAGTLAGFLAGVKAGRGNTSNGAGLGPRLESMGSPLHLTGSLLGGRGLQATAEAERDCLQAHTGASAKEAPVAGPCDDATSSASFDSWNSRQGSGPGASSSGPGVGTAAPPGGGLSAGASGRGVGSGSPGGAAGGVGSPPRGLTQSLRRPSPTTAAGGRERVSEDHRLDGIQQEKCSRFLGAN